MGFPLKAVVALSLQVLARSSLWAFRSIPNPNIMNLVRLIIKSHSCSKAHVAIVMGRNRNIFCHDVAQADHVF